MSYTVTKYDPYTVTITGGTATAGGIASIPNPEGVDLVITDWKLAVTANSTGAANLTIGTAASPGTAAANSLLTTTAMATSAGSVYTGVVGGTAAGQNVTTTNKWGSADYIVVNGSASTVGLSALLFVKYYRIES